MTTLNFSDQPVKRGQYQPGPVVPADGAAVSALEARIAALEAAVAALQTASADHESRITALEP